MTLLGDGLPTTMNGTPMPDFVKDRKKHSFMMKVSQAFHGAHEIHLYPPVVIFTYSKTGKACMQFGLRTHNIQVPKPLEISFRAIEQISLLPPEKFHYLLCALSVHIEERFSRRLIAVTGAHQPNLEKLRSCPLYRSTALKQLVFVFSPWPSSSLWSELYLRKGEHEALAQQLDPSTLESWDKFKEKMNAWIYPSRMMDLKGKKIAVPNDIAFYEEYSREQWLEMMRKVGLRNIDPTTSNGKNYVFDQELFLKKGGKLKKGFEPAVEVVSLEQLAAAKNGLTQNKLDNSELTLGEYLGAPVRGQKRPRENTVNTTAAATNENSAVNRGGIPSADHNRPPANVVLLPPKPSAVTKKPVPPCAISLFNFPPVPPAPLPVKKSSGRKKKEVEMIALDDDDDEEEEKKKEEEKMEDDSPVGTKGMSSLSLNPSLKGEKRAKLEVAADTVVFRYPPNGRNSVPIHIDDLRVLAHGEMLNDAIVEVHMRHVAGELQKTVSPSKIHIFNTFFWSKLTEKPPSTNVYRGTARAATQRFDWVKRNFQRVKSWTKKVDIFQMDYLVIPVNDECHWYVIIVVKPSLAVSLDAFSADDVAVSRKRGATRPDPLTTILVLDSLQDGCDYRRLTVPDVVRDYLECELEDKKGAEGGRVVRTQLHPVHPRDLPRQLNYVDCGVYLVSFFEEFIMRPPTNQQLLQPGGSWLEWYPNFERVTLKFMRDKMIGRFRQLCGPEMWSALEKYERSMGRGVTVLTEEAKIDHARRPRRHSCHRAYTRHPQFASRSVSEPPDPLNCPPPRGLPAHAYIKQNNGK